MKHFQPYKRLGYALIAVVLLIAVASPAFRPMTAKAAPLGRRSITLSDSGASGNSTITSGVGSGTAVTYRVSIITFASADSLVIDFCTQSALTNDTCTAPTGMTAASATVSNGVGGSGTIGSWTIVPGASQVRLTRGAGATAAAGTHVFSISGVTNPSTVGSFYARIYTYTNTTYGTYASATSTGNFVDYGGVALSTNRIISITARVQEQLTFCVSGANPSLWTTNNDCSDANAARVPSLTLGHGTPVAYLDSSQVDSGTVFSQLSTNATQGASIAMRSSNSTCTNDGGSTFPSGLSADNGATCAIPGIGSTPSAITAGTANFGLFVWNSVTSSNGVGTITPSSTYHDSGFKTFTTTAGAPLVNFNTAGNANTSTNPSGDIFPAGTVKYGMDYTTAESGIYGNVRTTFGSVVATCTAPVYRVNNAYTFAATTSLITPAGIYSANIDLIATGKF